MGTLISNCLNDCRYSFDISRTKLGSDSFSIEFVFQDIEDLLQMIFLLWLIGEDNDCVYERHVMGEDPGFSGELELILTQSEIEKPGATFELSGHEFRIKVDIIVNFVLNYALYIYTL